MTKAELVALVHERTAKPLGGVFTAGLLDDLIKDGLASPGRRVGNDGRRPIYDFTWRDLHRVTFLAAIQASGVRSRNALRLRLFVAGCKLPLWEIREALRNEYRDAMASLNGQVRTAYLDSRKPLTPAKFASVTRELGRADPILQSAGLETPPEAMIQIIRDARQEPLAGGLGDVSPDLIARLASGKASMADLVSMAGNMFAGMFQMEAAPGDDPGQIDSVDGLISNADDTALECVPSQFRNMLTLLATHGVWNFIPEGGGPSGVRSVIVRTIKRSPQFLAFNLVLALRMAVANPGKPSIEQLEFMNWLMKEPDRILQIQAANSPDEKLAIGRNYFDEFNSIRDSRRQ
jgi:hypothetical protein